MLQNIIELLNLLINTILIFEFHNLLYLILFNSKIQKNKNKKNQKKKKY